MDGTVKNFKVNLILSLSCIYHPIYRLIVVYLFLYTYLYSMKLLLSIFMHYGALLGIFSDSDS